MTDFAAARKQMVDSQLLPNRVTDARLIETMGAVARETFVPAALRGVAYVDDDLQVAPGRYVMEPMVFARLLQEAGVKKTDAVLDVGCATGYSAAILARLANVVVALEEDEALSEQASATLASADVVNAVAVTGRLSEGYAHQAPYDVIVLEGAVEHVPQRILDQLAEGGRLVAVIAGRGIGKAVLFTRSGGVIGRRELFDASTPMLPGFALEAGFVF
ncbi:protein-L-isoaspartate O-methyltransferase [Iodidimonas sp. SYSU 1G8]|uniref:protein-L-isoaspartate O-methyltransferase family protein n=1 Tax=Iodidimonas sp. SYSU 1G8 TaxID=3133967 RepID=UPI0031FF352C